MASQPRAPQLRGRPIWFKTRGCSKRTPHVFAECHFHHLDQGLDDRHLFWPEIPNSIPFTIERLAAQQRYYEGIKARERWDEQEALALERRIKYQEFEARGELKAIGCRVAVNHDWPSCRFGHNRLNPRTGVIENDFDEEAVARRQRRIAEEKAAKRQERIEERIRPEPANFPPLTK
jgi:hypothetical protein